MISSFTFTCELHSATIESFVYLYNKKKDEQIKLKRFKGLLICQSLRTKKRRQYRRKYYRCKEKNRLHI